jgi:hypothetical protein
LSEAIAELLTGQRPAFYEAAAPDRDFEASTWKARFFASPTTADTLIM